MQNVGWTFHNNFDSTILFYVLVFDLILSDFIINNVVLFTFIYVLVPISLLSHALVDFENHFDR